MIRVHKSDNTPISLAKNMQYNGKDVERQLFDDQDNKCYICERLVGTDFQIEHHKSQIKHPELTCDWHNLFLSCNYCNNKKKHLFELILNPEIDNIEELIQQYYDTTSKKFIFKSERSDEATNNTIKLLDRVYNGTNAVKSLREEIFFNKTFQIMTKFKSAVVDYLDNQDDKTTIALKEQLSKSSELLGLKYWIIKTNPKLYSVFAADLVWNK